MKQSAAIKKLSDKIKATVEKLKEMRRELKAKKANKSIQMKSKFVC